MHRQPQEAGRGRSGKDESLFYHKDEAKSCVIHVDCTLSPMIMQHTLRSVRNANAKENRTQANAPSI